MKCQLSEVANLIAGFAFKSKDFGKADNAKVIKITHIVPPSVDMDHLVSVDTSSYDVNKLEKYIAQKGDYVMAMTGATIGKIGRIETGEAYINQRVLLFEPTERINDDYLYYVLQQYEFSQYVLNHIDSESAQPNISANTVGKYEFELPSMDIQKKIGKCLRLLDEKAQQNIKINNNLQQQAQALFKEWFIDNPDSENWSIGTFSELIQSTLCGDWGKEAPTGNNTEKVYCVRGADIPEVKAGNKGKMPTRYILPKNYASKKLTSGDIVVEISGGSPTQSTGRCTAISESLLNRYDSGMVCTNFCRAIKPIAGYSMFIYYYWQYLYDKGVFFSYENGTTGIKNLDISGFLGTEPIVIPPKEKVLAFNIYCQTVFDQIFANGKESEQLAQLRDTLLPKLMSGELDISNANL